MKKFSFDIHYDMVITGIEVMADTLEEAQALAYEQGARLPLESMECVGKDACLDRTEELTARELRTMEREKVTEFVSNYIEQLTPTEVYEIAQGEGVNWLEWVGDDETEFYNNLFTSISNLQHPDTALFDRYARMYARSRWQEVADMQGAQWDKAFGEAKKYPTALRVIVETIESDTCMEHSNRYFMVDYWPEVGQWVVIRSDTATSPYDVRRPNNTMAEGYADEWKQLHCRLTNTNNATRWAERMINAGRVLDIHADTY